MGDTMQIVIGLILISNGLTIAIQSYSLRRLRKREVLWREVCESTMRLAYLEAKYRDGVRLYEKDRIKDKINELKQKLGYDN